MPHSIARLRARAAVAPTTHFAPWNAPKDHYGRQRAVCGVIVELHEISPAPQCPICRDWLEADAAALRSLQEDP